MTRLVALLTVLTLALPIAAAGPADKAKKEKQPEPDHVVVQHILISFEGRLGHKKINRDEAKARYLAYQLLERARKGEDFDALVKEFTDDQHPGIYKLANKGVEKGPGEYSRTQMVGAFGDVSFSLAVGEVGIADYNPERSPFGWHIVKRLE